jgi:hypothetical protein
MPSKLSSSTENAYVVVLATTGDLTTEISEGTSHVRTHDVLGDELGNYLVFGSSGF